jgi:hypothetical protein
MTCGTCGTRNGLRLGRDPARAGVPASRGCLPPLTRATTGAPRAAEVLLRWLNRPQVEAMDDGVDALSVEQLERLHACLMSFLNGSHGGSGVCAGCDRGDDQALVTRGLETARSRKPRSISASLGGLRSRRVARPSASKRRDSDVRGGTPPGDARARLRVAKSSCSDALDAALDAGLHHCP